MMPDIMKLMQQFQKIQGELKKAQKEISLQKVSGSSGGGMVEVTLNGNFEVVDVRIEESLLKEKDIQMLNDLVLAAVNDGIKKVKELTKERMRGLTGGLNIPEDYLKFLVYKMYSVKSLNKLIGELSKLPGIGEKSAQRIAFFILKERKENAFRLAESIKEVKEKVKYCSICGNVTEEDPCPICQDETRDKSIICVIEEPQDVFLFEKIRRFKGVYHILRGAISPIKGIGPEDINIKSLLERVKKGKIKEIILATDPNVEGETTAMYIYKLFFPLGVKITRLAHGLPAGGDLEFADELTLLEALEGRREMHF